ncbi:hypothetical protein TWF694_005899 [Orbilia ellipsospora]|uniref:Intraflagellar transport protein 122 homolog n=1 Tax=Orbilia ellipsospora TaxID=2528407 RepID=A0AAV9WSC0_9PEZI
MDGLSATSSVIAVIQISVSIAKICAQYIKEVKNAKKDIEEVKKRAEALLKLFIHVQSLLDGPKREKLRTSKELDRALSDCKEELEELRNKLENQFANQATQQQKRRNKLLSKVGIATVDFKWPFSKSEVDGIVARLDKFQTLIDSALQIDQIHIILSIEQEANLERLPVSGGAIFNSFEDEQEPECLPETRVELLDVIKEWIVTAEPNLKSPKDRSKPIFWLCGMAGTGKSTVARTVARLLRDNAQLGASFFFKRGKAHRGDASRLISTIAMDLRRHIPQLGPKISDAVERDPSIHLKALSEQFDKLIFKPLSQIDSTAVPSPTVIVIDALDECDGEGVARNIIMLLERLQDVDLDLRIFVTSRPETPIKLGFKELADSTQNVALHDIQLDTIKHDISVFIRHKMVEIRNDRGFSETWPGDGTIETLTEIMVPLFISAATACRFIADPKFSAKRRLDAILKLKNVSFASKLAKTYLPIFEHLLEDTDEMEKEELAAEFQKIIGTLVLLESPLCLKSLSRFIDHPEDEIQRILDLLQSVINAPEDPNFPIQTFHLSFRDFLLDSSNKKQWFWLDKDLIHKQIVKYCIRRLSKSLKENICNLRYPGAMCSDLSDEVELNITPEVQYACQYWIPHLERCVNSISEEDKRQIYSFLKEHLLHWLEVMNLLGVGFQTIHLIVQLELVVQTSGGIIGNEFLKFLNDAKRFVQMNQHIASKAPLQLYSSALIFAPESSLVRNAFWHKVPKWITRPPKVQNHWSPLIQTLEAHKSIRSITFSPDGKYLVSGLDDATILLWDANSGVILQNFNGHTDSVFSVAFSIDGKRLASGSVDGTIKLWDTNSGSLLRTIIAADHVIPSVSFSPDGTTVASASSNSSVKLWDAISGDLLQTLSHEIDPRSRNAKFAANVRNNSVAFSPNGKKLASNLGRTLNLWELVPISLLHTDTQPDCISLIRFSPDSRILVGAVRRKIKIWDAESCVFLHDLYDTSGLDVYSPDFSPDGRYLAFSVGKTISILDIESKKVLQTFEERGALWQEVAFSPNEGRLALASSRKGAVRIWEPTALSEGGLSPGLENSKDELAWLTFSPNGQFLVTKVGQENIDIWDVASGALIQKAEQGGYVTKFEFSPDGTRLASVDSNGRVCLWNVENSWALVNVLKLKGYGIREDTAFSSNPWLLADCAPLGPWEAVYIWDLANGSLMREIAISESDGNSVRSIALSADGKLLATALSKRIRLWDVASGLPRGTTDYVCRGEISFSPDCQQLAFQSVDQGVHIWNITSGIILSLGFVSPGDSINAWAFPTDSELIAAGSKEKLFLWDRGSSAEIGSISFDCIERLDFSRVEDCVETEFGRVNLQDFGVASEDPHKSKPSIYFMNPWIKCNGFSFLWIPPDYRQSVMYGNTLAVSNLEGGMSFLEISDPFGQKDKVAP